MDETLVKAKGLIVEKIRRWDYVSFAELMRLLDENGIEGTGTSTMYLNNNPNMLIVVNGSEVLVQALKDLLRDKQIFPIPASVLVYMVDGYVPDLPLVKRNYQYKKPHWLPVAFRDISKATKRQLTIIASAASN